MKLINQELKREKFKKKFSVKKEPQPGLSDKERKKL
jgi:hypothetical protein